MKNQSDLKKVGKSFWRSKKHFHKLLMKDFRLSEGDFLEHYLIIISHFLAKANNIQGEPPQIRERVRNAGNTSRFRVKQPIGEKFRYSFRKLSVKANDFTLFQ